MPEASTQEGIRVQPSATTGNSAEDKRMAEIMRGPTAYTPHYTKEGKAVGVDPFLANEQTGLLVTVPDAQVPQQIAEVRQPVPVTQKRGSRWPRRMLAAGLATIGAASVAALGLVAHVIGPRESTTVPNTDPSSNSQIGSAGEGGLGSAPPTQPPSPDRTNPVAPAVSPDAPAPVTPSAAPSPSETLPSPTVEPSPSAPPSPTPEPTGTPPPSGSPDPTG